MISLTNYDFQWARSELVIIYPDMVAIGKKKYVASFTRQLELFLQLEPLKIRHRRPRKTMFVQHSKEQKYWLVVYNYTGGIY